MKMEFKLSIIYLIYTSISLIPFCPRYPFLPRMRFKRLFSYVFTLRSQKLDHLIFAGKRSTAISAATTTVTSAAATAATKTSTATAKAPARTGEDENHKEICDSLVRPISSSLKCLSQNQMRPSFILFRIFFLIRVAKF